MSKDIPTAKKKKKKKEKLFQETYITFSQPKSVLFTVNYKKANCLKIQINPSATEVSLKVFSVCLCNRISLQLLTCVKREIIIICQ